MINFLCFSGWVVKFGIILSRVMDTFVLALMVLLAAQQIASSPNDTLSIYINGSQCTFFYSLPNQDYFIFIRCSILGEEISDWNTCLAKCCTYTTAESSPSYQVLERCQPKKQPRMRGELIAICIISSTVLFCIVCYICKIVCMNCGNPCISRAPIKEQENLEEPIEWVEEKQVNENINKIRWSSLSNQRLTINSVTQICCICLESNTNVQLICGHLFHQRCLSNWLQKSNICPLCRRENIRSVKIYCRSCLWRYFVCRTSLLVKYPESFPSKCEGCGVKKGRKESEDFINESKLLFHLDRTIIHSHEHEEEQ